MARPREFDRDVALENATRVFWAKGYAATSTEDLVEAMGIGRQSLYNAFGDKHRLYLEALAAYSRRSTSGHIERLNAPASALQGVTDLLLGLIPDDDRQRGLGCMGVGAVGEFGATDPDLAALRDKFARGLHAALLKRLREGQTSGLVDRGMEPGEAASFIEMTMTGIQLAARGGASAAALRRMVRFAVDRLKPA